MLSCTFPGSVSEVINQNNNIIKTRHHRFNVAAHCLGLNTSSIDRFTVRPTQKQQQQQQQIDWTT